jgi:hypothetical protein
MLGRRWVFAALATSFAALVACSSKPSSSGPPQACVAGAISASGACESCIQSSCASALGNYESACSDYFACACPDGSFNASYEGACETQATESGCESETEALAACEMTSCSKPCAPPDAGEEGGNTTDATGQVTFACTTGTGSTMACNITTVSSSSATSAEQSCATQGGTVASTCTSVGLSGCCILNTTNTSCYYDSEAGATEADGCLSQSGMWSTTVP